VLEAINARKIKSCLIDGEIAVCDEHGLAVFQRLRHGSRIKPEAVLIAFDLLELDGEDLRPMPIEARKRRLAHLVRGTSAGLHLSEHLHGDGTEVFEHPASLAAKASSASESVRATSPAAPRIGSRSRTQPRPRSDARRRRTGAKKDGGDGNSYRN
jgi:ATP dependent DNA ligase domain